MTGLVPPDNTGGMVPTFRRLDRYLHRSKLTRDAFGRLVGTTGPVVSRWASGARVPSLAFAIQIERATAGEIPAASWVASSPRRAA